MASREGKKTRQGSAAAMAQETAALAATVTQQLSKSVHLFVKVQTNNLVFFKAFLGNPTQGCLCTSVIFSCSFSQLIGKEC